MQSNRSCLRPPLLAILLSVVQTVASAAQPSPEAIGFFEKRIRPVLIEHCYECHSAAASELEGGLMLDNRAAIEKGGGNGKVLVPGDPVASRLLTAMKYQDENLQMPPSGMLSEAILADFEQWIRNGAIDPRDGPAPPPPDSIEARARKHWAFVPPTKSPRPTVVNSQWPKADTDYFVLSRLEAAGIDSSPLADSRTLVRRLYFDLTGLPPTFEDVARFEASEAPDAYGELVDQLLESQQFGERWARHWLDVARFGDTKGYVFTADRNYPNAYKYRDWVINALNSDMPFDQFLKYQLAADRLVEDGNRSDLAAMGYLTLGRRFINNTHDIIDDRIDVVFRGTMGLTVGCSRCHDHKYDPVSTRDYYGMYGMFISCDEKQDDDLPLRLVDKANPQEVGIFQRGNPSNRGDRAPRQYLSFFAGEQAKPFTQGSGRLELAEAIANRNNPLTARVFLNRVWAHLFGNGLVRTPSDFGLRSETPIHRDVLDHLAVTFMEDNWSVKRLVRRIVTSSVYRQSSEIRSHATALDPENLLLWRVERRRLDFEAMRDSILTTSGQLDRTVGGESVQIANEAPSKRRTLYAFIDRQNLPGLFRTFDFASPDTHSPQRPETTVPQQALYLMNNVFVQDSARVVVEQLDDTNVEERTRQLYRFVLARDASPDELKLAANFIESGIPLPEHLVGNPWRFGYGSYNTDAEPPVSFRSLPHFAGNAWQGGPERPDPTLGWVILNGPGGHSGNDQEHIAIRRWYAQADGELIVKGKLEHPSEQGDGVRGRVVSSREGILGEWTAQHGSVDTNSMTIEVKRGDTIDFLTDCRENSSHDSFHWRVTIRRANGTTDHETAEWKSEDGFHGPLAEPLGPWQRLAQTLMLTNEFMFLD
ncbi:MAG: PSD1 domain-containing protein [Planctomycetes bacterium]|nr:PSD1 domain-containing protein [Planctomycetota bacterium]